MKYGGVSFFSLGGGGLLAAALFLPLLDGCGREVTPLALATTEIKPPENLFFLYPPFIGACVALSFVLALGRGWFSTLALAAVSIAMTAVTYIVAVAVTGRLWRDESLVLLPKLLFAAMLVGLPVLAANIGLMKFWKTRSAVLIIGACHQVAAVGLIASLFFLLFVISQDSRLTPLGGLWVEFSGAGLILFGSSLQMRATGKR